MLFYTAGQAYVFLALFAAGAAGGAWYDFLRRLGARLRAGRLLTAFLDALFSAGLFLLLAFSLLVANRLEMRLYTLLAAALGMAAYLFAFMPALDAIARWAGRIGRRLGASARLKKIFQFLCR